MLTCSLHLLSYLAAAPREPITVTFPDGATKEGTSWETTPFQLALAISKSLAEKTVICKVRKNSWVMAPAIPNS